MNLNETKAILKDVALIDNRKLDEAVAMAWHAVIGHMQFDVAKQALILARQDASVGYLEPRHVVQWGKEASFRMQRDKTTPAEALEGIPEPLCAAHRLRITSCRFCCHRMAQKAEEWNMFEEPSRDNNFHDAMNANTKRLHAWAKENIYA